MMRLSSRDGKRVKDGKNELPTFKNLTIWLSSVRDKGTGLEMCLRVKVKA